jgi:NAD(P)-dependent dehydrogenase (short-subunit alcohol dehydrogenase family)
MSKGTALVTGASEGFGRQIAERLIREGYTVYGTSRRSQPDTPTGVKMRVLELTSADSIAACVQGIVTEAGSIDVLINNAGRFHMGLIEETPVEEVELLFQTNFLGVARVTNAVLPVMRRQKRGRIVIMGSLAGVVGVSGMGYTSAVKHALEGYAEALRIELEPLGILVSIMQPSYFRTDIYDRRITSGQETPIADYDAIRTALNRSLEADNAQGGDPARVADKVLTILQSSAPRLRYPVGKDAALLVRLKRYMPEAMFLRGMRARLKG